MQFNFSTTNHFLINKYDILNIIEINRKHACGNIMCIYTSLILNVPSDLRITELIHNKFSLSVSQQKFAYFLFSFCCVYCEFCGVWYDDNDDAASIVVLITEHSIGISARFVLSGGE